MKIRRFATPVILLVLTGLALAQTDQQTAKPMRVRMSPGVTDKNKIRDVKPEYPLQARAQRIQGEVLLQIVIDTKGKTTEIKVLHGVRLWLKPPLMR